MPYHGSVPSIKPHLKKQPARLPCLEALNKARESHVQQLSFRLADMVVRAIGIAAGISKQESIALGITAKYTPILLPVPHSLHLRATMLQY